MGVQFIIHHTFWQILKMKFLIIGPSWVGDAVMAQTLYKLIKDSRTNYETSNASAVLDGKIDRFLELSLTQ